MRNQIAEWLQHLSGGKEKGNTSSGFVGARLWGSSMILVVWTEKEKRRDANVGILC